MEILFLIGAPCSGKSTWARDFVLKNNTYIRLNRDDLRLLFTSEYKINGFVESTINSVYENIIRRCISADMNLLIDDTNCNLSTINSIKKLASEKNVVFSYKFFEVSPLKQKIRNFIRGILKKQKIPKEVMQRMNSRFKIIKSIFNSYGL